MNFVSRKQLEVRHSKSYDMRERLKELGCEWDPIARAWIAPSIEVRELCYSILEDSKDSKEITYRKSPGAPQFDNFCEELAAGVDVLNSQQVSTPLAKSIVHTPTKEEAEKICEKENIQRYWRSEIESEAASILASGESNWNRLYERLEDAGWRARSVSILVRIVEHFRSHPPALVLDEFTDAPAILASKAVASEEMDGTISVIIDKATQEPTALKITFSYSHLKINQIKWIKGRRWDAAKKCWLVPIESSAEVFQTFPHFRRSPKAAEIEQQNVNT